MAECNASSRYQDIISISTLISSGPPAVYQLRPKEEKFGTLTRKTVGEKNLMKTNRTILLVGETGAGKSTLINALVNYTMGVKFEDNIWFEIVEEEKRRQTESQTPDVTTYEIFGYEGKTLPYSLTIIDTPGFGDTRGIEHDVIVSEKLLDLFCSDDGVNELSAVGLVMKASENRVSDRLRYIFDSVMSLFGKNIEENIIALITHSDGVTPDDALEALEDANIKCAKDEKNEPVHFLFNNRQNKKRTEKNKVHLENAWGVTEAGIGKFKDFLEKSKPQKLNKTVEVLKARVRLTACIHNLQERIQLTEAKQREIHQTEEALSENNEITEVEVDEVYKDKQTVKGFLPFIKALTCSRCEENCQYPLWMFFFSQSAVIKNGRCTSCTGNCHESHHLKENWKYVLKTRKVKQIIQDVTKKYENDEKRSLKENLETEKKELQAEKIKFLDEAYQHVVNLEQIALNVNSLSTHVHLDVLIEKMKETGDTEKVEKLEEMKRRQDGGTTAGLGYLLGKLKFW